MEEVIGEHESIGEVNVHINQNSHFGGLLMNTRLQSSWLQDGSFPLSPRVCCHCLPEWQQRKEARGCMCKAVDREGKLVRPGEGARKSLALLEPGDKDTVCDL